MADQRAGAAQQGEAPSTSGSPPDCYLIVYNVAKKHNLGTLARCATAFNVKQICLVGSRSFNSFGSHGADAHVSLAHYATLEECCSALRRDAGCRVVGVEITPDALPVQSFPFQGPTAFMLGNEGQGLSARQLAACDGFVYIPQYGPGTASLNVAVAASIVLHHFALWAGYGERAREGAKFVVADRPQRTVARGFVPLTEAELAAERARRRAPAPADDDAIILDFSGEGAL